MSSVPVCLCSVSVSSSRFLPWLPFMVGCNLWCEMNLFFSKSLLVVVVITVLEPSNSGLQMWLNILQKQRKKKSHFGLWFYPGRKVSGRLAPSAVAGSHGTLGTGSLSREPRRGMTFQQVPNPYKEAQPDVMVMLGRLWQVYGFSAQIPLWGF